VVDVPLRSSPAKISRAHGICTTQVSHGRGARHVGSHRLSGSLWACLVARLNTEILTSSHIFLFVRSGWLYRALPTSYKNNPSARPGCEARFELHNSAKLSSSRKTGSAQQGSPARTACPSHFSPHARLVSPLPCLALSSPSPPRSPLPRLAPSSAHSRSLLACGGGVQLLACGGGVRRRGLASWRPATIVGAWRRISTSRPVAAALGGGNRFHGVGRQGLELGVCLSRRRRLLSPAACRSPSRTSAGTRSLFSFLSRDDGFLVLYSMT
jgi:hypothetical protein